MNNSKIFKLNGKVQHYAWGGSDFIPALLHQSNSSKQPFAEYWMGAHDNVPSEVVLSNDESQPLNEFIKNNPAGILGDTVQSRFGRLPYLFKVLDVKDMLSIQVHPSKEAAVTAFDMENRKGTPLNAPDRNYKDDNHKPELMLALSDFWLLHGFKSPELLTKLLLETPELQFLLPVFDGRNYDLLYETVMLMPQQEVNERLQHLVERIVPLYEKGALDRSQEDFWAARAYRTFCKPDHLDRGIFSIYFFNLVNLKPGEAVFQDAGIPHAYLEGQNMELMANSDNVLRGGLTNKHVDVTELMHHVRFEQVIPHILKGTPGAVAGEDAFQTPAADFELRRITIQIAKQVALNTATTDIFFVYSGTVQVTDGLTELSLTGGDSFLAISGASFTVKAGDVALVFRATVPGV